MAVVATLRIAPVKGLATVTPQRVHLDCGGVAEDRRLFLLDAGGSVVTLRSHPRLVQAVADLDLDGGVVRVAFPDGTVAITPLGAAGDVVGARLFGKDRVGRLLPGDVADGLSGLAGEPLRLVFAERVGTGWDEGAVSILGRASADAVGGPDRDAARYRMLVEVDDTEPYEEDHWVGRDVQLGDAGVRITHRLVRCVVINHSPATGEQDWDGLRTLTRSRGPEMCLGVIADVVSSGDVWVGSEVRVADSAEELLRR